MLKQKVIEKAHELGFASCRIATADPVSCEVLMSWLSEGRHATMRWMQRDPAARCDPASLLPGARSVICCALPFGDQGLLERKSRRSARDVSQSPSQQHSLVRSRCVELPVKHPPPPPNFRSMDSPSHDSGRCKIARFARGADYHVVVREKLKRLAGALRELMPGARTRCCVDTSPLMEKVLAARAGIGWVGRNTLLVNHELGSWFVLGEVITDVELESDKSIENRCGECRRCVRSCPTSALDEHSLDARRCISYLTIEHRGPIDEEFQPFIWSGAYGCDRCQEACPYNRSK